MVVFNYRLGKIRQCSGKKIYLLVETNQINFNLYDEVS